MNFRLMALVESMFCGASRNFVPRWLTKSKICFFNLNPSHSLFAFSIYLNNGRISKLNIGLFMLGIPVLSGGNDEINVLVVQNDV